MRTGAGGRPALGAVALLGAGAAVVIAAGAGAGPAGTPFDAACARPGWVGVWAMPISDANGAALPAGTTLREIVYPHLGGTQVRVTLSDRFSAAAVVVGGATIGVQGRGAAVVPGSVVPLTFGGAAGVTIPAGGQVTSDPVRFSFRAFQSLAVTAYLASADPTPAEHLTAEQIDYLSAPAAGDRVADPSAAGFARAPQTGDTKSVFSSDTLVSGVEAYAPSTQGSVVAIGDSITDGLLVDGADTPDVRWPDVLAHRLLDAGVRLSVVNAGISGDFLTIDPAGVPEGSSVETRFTADALGQAGVKTVILLAGINDIHRRADAPALEAADTRIIAAAHAAGLRILLATLTPAGHPGDAGAGVASTQQLLALNVWIRSQRLADGVIDFDAVVADSTTPTQLAARYDGGDHLHLSAAGYTAMGDAVPLGQLLPRGCIPGQ